MKRLVLMLVLSCLAMGMAYGQRKQRTEDWNKETSVGNEIPGKKTFGYIVGENGDLIYDGPCTITCTLPYTRVYESTCWSRNGLTLYNDYEHKGKYKWQGSYKKGLLDGAVSVEDEYYRAGEWLTTNLYLTDYTTISYSFALSGKFTSGVPNGSFSVVQDGEEVLDATYKDGALVGYFYCHEHHGNISDGGKLTGEWVVDRYVEMEFIEGVLLSKTTSDRSTRPADVELARKYAKGEITKQELWDKHFIVVRTASIDLGSCARAIIMSETYDLPHFNDEENIFYYEYLDYIVEDSVIRAETFKGDKELTSITIPNSVTSIGYCAFYDCSSLTSITIPNSVTSIGDYAFYGCSSLKSVKVANKYCYDYFKNFGVPDITFIVSTPKEYEEAQKLGTTKLAIDSNSKYASEDGLYLIDNGKLILFIGKDLTEYTIPESVTSIEYGAFSGCSSLTSITIPNSVTSIGYAAFRSCSSLTSITIPNSVTSIGESAFRGCNSLTSITIGNSVTSIGRSAFNGCSRLTSITIGNSVTSIGEWAFNGCSSLTSITIPNSVKSIGSDAFRGCSSLTSITIPESVTSIGEGAFAYCSSLTSITIPNSITSIGEEAFYGCSSLTSITIGNSVTSIGQQAFRGCSSLKSVKVANKDCYDYFKDKIANIAFYGANASDDGRCLIIDGMLERFSANGINEYTIPESITSIGVYAFYDCISLTSITIPNSVTSIGRSAFNGCISLTSITCLATTPPAIDNIRIGETTMIYVPKKAVKAYKQDPKWSIYKKQIKAIK